MHVVEGNAINTITSTTAPITYKMAATKAAFCPQRQSDKSELLAISGSDVTLFKVMVDGSQQLIEQVGVLACGGSLKRNSIASEGVIIPDHSHSSSSASSSVLNSSAPITSISWSNVDPNLLVTASYDTTCTIWNVETRTIKTQLIAHDKEVFDVCFSPNRSDTFVSVGAEGSVRVFDTRYTIY